MRNIDSIVNKIQDLLRKQQTLLIAIDGRGGSGKSTLAEKLKKEFSNLTIVHLDDFAYPMGGADRQRLLEQVILPLKNNKPAHYQRYDWKTKQLSDWIDIQSSGIVIFEGVLTLHDVLYKHYDFKIWLDCSAEIGFQRGVVRDLAQYHVDTKQEWLEKWMPEETKAIEEQQPQKKADYVVDEENE